MQLSDYNYNLPDSAIADRPPEVRGTTKLLKLDRRSGEIVDSLYKKLGTFLKSGDLLVVNNTKVLPARLLCATEQGAERELLLLEQHGQNTDHTQSMVMYRRKIREGQKLYIADSVIVVKEVLENGTALITSSTDLWRIAERHGSVPLPPYMHRQADDDDRERYQTVFAENNGSVAAPTASLNLTQELMAELRSNAIEFAEVTLHVGLGTFMPIRVDDVTKHKMHQEYFEIPASTIEAIQKTKERGSRVIAVGTTVTRTLEYNAEKILDKKTDRMLTGEADIFIYPGYKFKIVDGLLTNYHAPQSTVLMMASAFAGWDNLKRAYEHALQQKYKFLSYGDSMLIL